MEIIAGLFQVPLEVGVIGAAKESEQFGARGRKVDAPLSIFIAQALARRPVIRAKIGVGFDRRAVGVKGVDVGGHGSGVFVPRVAVNAIEDGREAMVAEELQVVAELPDGGPT